MIDVISWSDRYPTINATSALRGEQPRDVLLGIGAWGIPFFGSDLRLRRSELDEIGDAVSFGRCQSLLAMLRVRFSNGCSVVLRIGESFRLGVRDNPVLVLAAKSRLNFGDALGVLQAVVRCVAHCLFLIGFVVGFPFSQSLLAVLGIPFRVVASTFGFLFGEKTSGCLGFLHFPQSMFRRCGNVVYNLVSHAERSCVRLVRNAVAPGPGCGVSHYSTVGPCQQGVPG